jgi:hypothetical protein
MAMHNKAGLLHCQQQRGNQTMTWPCHITRQSITSMGFPPDMLHHLTSASSSNHNTTPWNDHHTPNHARLQQGFEVPHHQWQCGNQTLNELSFIIVHTQVS